MADIDDLDILTNGNFPNGLTGWNVENPSGNDAPGVFSNSGLVSFNSGNETLFGDSIDQDFATTVGNNGGNADHTFEIVILDDIGTAIETAVEIVYRPSGISSG
ncbi:MAG: hypothetical protein AAF409_18955 [Pseudomonadota bacterium]